MLDLMLKTQFEYIYCSVTVMVKVHNNKNKCLGCSLPPSAGCFKYYTAIIM